MERPWDPSRLLRCGLVCWKPIPIYIWEPALGGHQPYVVTDLNISGQGYICTGIYVAIYISMCFLKLQFEIHWYLQDIFFLFLRLIVVAINLEFHPL